MDAISIKISFGISIYLTVVSANVISIPISRGPTIGFRRGRQRQLQSSMSANDLYQGQGTHYVNLFVGCPSQLQTAFVDTGSHTTAFRCSNCTNCGGQLYHLDPFYNETNSSCFSEVRCGLCGLPESFCSSNGLSDADHCLVNVSYAEGSSWSGVEAEDLFSIDGADEQKIFLRFACQTELTGFFLTQPEDGVLGMDKTNSSVWKQLYDQGQISTQQFSLCFNLEEKFAAGAGVMVIGGVDHSLDDLEMSFANDVSISTSFLYRVTIRKMYIRLGGGESVVSSSDAANITEVTLPTEQSPIVDSGTTNTYLNRDLSHAFAEAWSASTNQTFSSLLNVTAEELLTLPTIIFQLAGFDEHNSKTKQSSAQHLDPANPSDILVAFPPSRYLARSTSGSYYLQLSFSELDSGVLGANFIAGHNVFFDVEHGRIGFAESKCIQPVSENVTTTPGGVSPSTSPSNVLLPTVDGFVTESPISPVTAVRTSSPSRSKVGVSEATHLPGAQSTTAPRDTGAPVSATTNTPKTASADATVSSSGLRAPHGKVCLILLVSLISVR